jgi:hypothetical protein
MCLDATNERQPTLRRCERKIYGQQWRVAPAGDRFVTFTNRRYANTKCLDIVNDGRSNDRVTLAACEDVSGQHWSMKPAR